MKSSFLEDQKRLALTVSDQLSSQTQLNIACSCESIKDVNYQELSQSIPGFSYVAIFESDQSTERVLSIFEPQFVLTLSNFVLGGQGKIKIDGKESFSFSERFVARAVVDNIHDYYQSLGLSLKVLRVEEDLGLVHSFYHEETVAWVNINSTIKGQDAGKAHLCYASTFFAENAPNGTIK